MDRIKRSVARYFAALDEADRLDDELAESSAPPASQKDKIAQFRELMAAAQAPAARQPRPRKVR
jgi:hypothetical protein